MLERYLADWLSRNCGSFLQDVDRRRVSLNVRAGRLDVQDVKLVEQTWLRFGTIGNFSLRIPWTLRDLRQRGRQALTDADLALVLEDVRLVLAVPNGETGYTSPGKEQLSVLQQVQASVEQHYLSYEPAPWWQRKLKEMLPKVSVTIHDIHIRYEQPDFVLTSAGRGFAVGLQLGEFTLMSPKSEEAESADENDKDGTISTEEGKETQYTTEQQSTVIMKRAQTRNLSIYWDSHCRLVLRQDCISQAMDQVGSSTVASADTFAPRHFYVLDSFSPTLDVQLGDATTLQVTLPPCRWALSSAVLADVRQLRAVWLQYMQQVSLQKSLEQISTLPRRTSRQRWIYALAALQALAPPRRLLWKRFGEMILLRRRYIDLLLEWLEQKLPGRSRVDAELVHLDEELRRLEEAELLPNEIAAFWRHAIRFYLTDEQRRSLSEDAESPATDLDRYRALCETVFTMERSQHEKQEDTGTIDQHDHLVWSTRVSCTELALQLCDADRGTFRVTPVARMSASFLLEQQSYNDGSWEMESHMGSFFVKDLTSSATRFPKLVGPRRMSGDTEYEIFEMAGVQHIRNVWVRLERRSVWSRETLITSTTQTRVRVTPLEIVYATAPVEALSRFFQSAKMEMTDDLLFLSSKMSAWRERQKRRLLEALSHREKTILVDVDVGAPTILLPEGNNIHEHNLVAIDLGTLKFCNDGGDMSAAMEANSLEDRWKLVISSVQVQSYPIATRFSSECVESVVQKIVEPFILSFDITSRVEMDSDGLLDSAESSFVVSAVLPSLTFNCTASAIRLVRLLQSQWTSRKAELRQSSMLRTASTSSLQFLTTPSRESAGHQVVSDLSAPGRPHRVFRMRFSAPLLVFRLSNDVDGRDREHATTTAIADVTIRGITVTALSEKSHSSDTKLELEAELGAITAIDLFQTAGDDFSHLLSSTNPRDVINGYSDTDRCLVSIRYEGLSPRVLLNGDKVSANNLVVSLYELFVEWNPETFAALSHAFSIPSDAEDTSEEVSENDEFFDAEEDGFEDALSVVSEYEVDDGMISEIASSRCSSFSDFDAFNKLSSSSAPGPLVLFSQYNILPGSEVMATTAPQKLASEQASGAPLAISFKLSKLSINFNKESRHRRLLVAEMDGTEVHYKSRASGGSETHAMIGNLVFSDADFTQNRTLYKEILGLDVSGDEKPSSLLELKIFRNRRSRTFTSLSGSSEDGEACADTSVLIDAHRNRVQGCDTYVKANFSPMRFVYLQQLWLEAVDYFFDGIVGYEVWGSKRPPRPNFHDLDALAKDVHAFTFTRFHVRLDAPVILVPVTYCSTNFLRVSASSLDMSNYYDQQGAREAASGVLPPLASRRLQWFNNCVINLDDMQLTNCLEEEITRTGDVSTGRISLNWPVGPAAVLNTPKWKMRASFDSMKLALAPFDFSLLQNVISRNIGEESRHMNEWYAMQCADELVLSALLRAFRVRFGYDAKDVAPSTFDLEIQCSQISFSFRTPTGGELALAVCSEVIWRYVKLTDRITKQSVDCSIEIRESLMAGGSVVLGSSGGSVSSPSQLRYSSVSEPSGNNSKTLALTNPLVSLDVKSWYMFSRFFANLPSPNMASPSVVIQVGDKWYKIGGSSDAAEALVNDNVYFSWLPFAHSPSENRDVSESLPRYEFSFEVSDCVVDVGPLSERIRIFVESSRFFHVGHKSMIQRQLSLRGFSVSALLASAKGGEFESRLLFEPLVIEYNLSQCNGQCPCVCEKHVSSVEASSISGSVPFSQLVVLLSLRKALLDDLSSAQTASMGIFSTGTPMGFIKEVSTPEEDSVGPRELEFWVTCPKMAVVVVDDSGRHFAGEQDLVSLSLVNVRGSSISQEKGSSQLKLTVDSIQMQDCLQSTASPFRQVVYFGVNHNLDAGAGASLSLERSISNYIASYAVNLVDVRIQYNPSLVVAAQRFLGRLRKKLKGSLLSGSVTEQTIEGENRRRNEVLSVRASFLLDHLRVQMNKEHQGRSLVELELRGVSSTFAQDSVSRNFDVDGRINGAALKDVDDYVSRGGILKENRAIMTVHEDAENFVVFSYRKFSHVAAAHGAADFLPHWVAEKSSFGKNIDDMLVISVASVKMVYFSSRTKELVDYLSNGLPGRGMGATSRAAKGFVKDRILKRSYLQLQMDAPVVEIPSLELDDERICLDGGALSCRSWVSVPESSRHLLLSVVGASLHTTGDALGARMVASSIDATLEVTRRSNSTEATVAIPVIELRVSYSHYSLIRSVMACNIKRKVDKQRWDNLEAAWEKESNGAVELLESATFSKDIDYGSEARIIHYGQKNSSSSRVLQARANVGRLTVLLRRDDFLARRLVPSGYDLMRFDVQGLDSTLLVTEDNARYTLTVQILSVKDCGAAERALMADAEKVHEPLSRDIAQSAFTLIVQPYVSKSREDEGESLAQVVLTADTTQHPEPETKLSLVLNNISITFLFSALREIVKFMSLELNENLTQRDSANSIDASVAGHVGEDLSPNGGDERAIPSTQNTRLHFVLHYPRFVFLADETDPHCRALIVDGLAIANYHRRTGPGVNGLEDGCTLLKLHADLQHVSSFIHPDASLELLSTSYVGSQRTMPVESEDRGDPVPLLLPVTLGIDYEDTTDGVGNRQRSVGVNIDRLSLMISQHDLLLVNALRTQLGSRSSARQENQPSALYEVTFHEPRLGIGLRRDPDAVVVDSALSDEIKVGDILRAINGSSVREDVTLAEVVNLLQTSGRPLVLQFVRFVPPDLKTQLNSYSEEASPLAKGEKIDVAVASSTLTLIDDDLPLFRGSLDALGVHVDRQRSLDSSLEVSASSTYAVDYFNLRTWAWEPFAEKAFSSVVVGLNEPHGGQKELTVEAGDRQAGPLLINATDDSSFVLGRMLSWKDLSQTGFADNAREVNKEAVEAANAALQFAKRQKDSSGRPYVFYNLTGLACAFGQQKAERRLESNGNGFSGVGDFDGLRDCDATDIAEVASGSSAKFFIDTNSSAGRLLVDKRTEATRLVVAIQTIAGLELQPIVQLEVLRPGNYLVPLRYRSNEDSVDRLVMMSWTVEQREETTLVTLATTISVRSELVSPIEVGYIPAVLSRGRPRTVKSIGCGESFHAPLLALLLNEGHLVARPSTDFDFGMVYDFASAIESEKKLEFEQIRCEALDRGVREVHLTTQFAYERPFTTFKVCSWLNIRNILPEPCDWELASISTAEVVDGSATRATKLDQGRSVDVLGQNSLDVQIRFRVIDWSNWIRFDDITFHSDQEVARVSVSENGMDRVPLNYAARVTRTRVGWEVCIYAELWIKNTTNLQLAFGCLSDDVFAKTEEDQPSLSTAEAALKEISALFETGEKGAGFSRRRSVRDVNEKHVEPLRLQRGCIVVDECFEYVEIINATVDRRWWASQNPYDAMDNPMSASSCGGFWKWIDQDWIVDSSGETVDGWESSVDLDAFPSSRSFNTSDRFRRRRWFRRRQAASGVVNAVFHRIQPETFSSSRGKDAETRQMKPLTLAVQCNGGQWGFVAEMPPTGTMHGALRLTESRWPKAKPRPGEDQKTPELSFTISPLDGEWGSLTRLMVISPRFFVRNDSSTLRFEIKQYGAPESSAQLVSPGASIAFHWTDASLPELICVRPVSWSTSFTFSGGFDPLSIGVLPVRVRSLSTFIGDTADSVSIQSVRVECGVRAMSGGTGIKITLQEENSRGNGSLFRIDNDTTFPIWSTQDGKLALPSKEGGSRADKEGDLLLPTESSAFSLDVPFRQGKYSHRKAASRSELLRVRLALSPLSSRAGVETTKVVSLTQVGELVRLNPSKLHFLPQDLRDRLSGLRLLCVVVNDGPTRVLKIQLMRRELAMFSNPFNENLFANETTTTDPTLKETILFASEQALLEVERGKVLPQEDIVDALMASSRQMVQLAAPTKPCDRSIEDGIVDQGHDMLVSIRLSFSGFIVSFIDSYPSEIAVLSLKNLNALATFDLRRQIDSTLYITVAGLQLDNMVPNAPYPVAICQDESKLSDEEREEGRIPPLLVIGINLAPRHRSGIVCLKSITLAPRNLAFRFDLAFLVRIQKYAFDFYSNVVDHVDVDPWSVPDIDAKVKEVQAATLSDLGSQQFYFGGLTVLPYNISLSIAPARALAPAQAALEGPEASALHHAVRKGDVRLGGDDRILGVKVGHRNATPLAVVRGMFKSFVVDALLRLDGASLNFAGLSLRNQIASFPQLQTHVGAHYMASLRQNLPALVGSLAAFGNPLGLVRGLGDGVSDFVLEPVKGFQKSIQEMDATYLVDGVAKGTVSLARNTVGGFAGSAAALAETFSKNMTVLTLDRRYAQKRDRGDNLRDHRDVNVALGIGSGVQKLAQGFVEGVTGVVKAPIRGAEKRGLEGFAKGLGKGLLGLLVKPIIGISDGITDVMIGVRGSVGSTGGSQGILPVRPRRATYGRDRMIRAYKVEDAAASALMMRTKLAGEQYLSHLEMNRRLALLSVRRVLLLGVQGEELLLLKYKHIESMEVRQLEPAVSATDPNSEDGDALSIIEATWGLVIVLNTPRHNGAEVEVIRCENKSDAEELMCKIQKGVDMAAHDY